MYADRKGLYNQLAKLRKTAVITYVTGDRQNLETQIAQDAVELFGSLLDNYEGMKRISLFLYTRGGDTLAAWSLVNLLREFCDYLEIIIPAKCHSSGTLICLGANQLVMSKQATLGPIDPSINSPLNPPIPGAPPHARLPVSVEDIAGFIEMAKSEGSITAQECLSQVFLKLADHVHPIALGRVKRARGQIQDLARKLMMLHTKDKKKIEKIIRVLSTDAGSHDYTIYRREARHDLGLVIETPSMKLYELMRDIYKDIRSELELDTPYNASVGLQDNVPKQYELTRALIESQNDGAFQLKKKGTLLKQSPAPGQQIIQDTVNYEGWEFVP